MPALTPLDQILAADRRRTTTVGPIALVANEAAVLADAATAVDNARRDLATAEATSPDPDTDPIVARHRETLASAEAAHSKLAAKTKTFTIEVGEVDVETEARLIADHQPTPDQRKAAKRDGGAELRFNPDTFPPAFLTESIIAVTVGTKRQTDLDAESVTALWGALNTADRTRLFTVAMTLAITPTMIGTLGKG